MKRISLLLLVFVLISTIAFTSFGASTEKIVIRMASGAQPTMPATMAAQKFADLVKERTNGRIEIEFFTSLALGEDAAIFEQLINGTIELGALGSAAYGPYTKLLNVLQLPFLLNSYDKEFAAAKSEELKDIFAAMEPLLGVKILALHEHGIRHIANNIRPVKSLEDIKGLKLRTVPNALMNDALKALGASPVALGYGECYTALQNKVIDGLEINFTSTFSQKFYEVLKYFTKVGLWPFPQLLTVNLDFFNSLSPEDQQIFLEAAAESTEVSRAILVEHEELALKTMEDAGMEVIEITDVQPFIDATKEVYDTYSAADPLMKKFVDMAKNLK